MSRKILTDSFALSASLTEAKANQDVQTQRPLFKGILYEKFDDGFGNPVLKKIGENTVVVGGAIQSLEHLCHVTAGWKPKTLNEVYGINTDTTGNDLNSRIALFGVGTGGSGLEFGSIVEKDVKRRDVPDLIPLRSSAALTGDDADLYYFKKDNGDGTYNYYLKEFAVDPAIKTCWKDAADDESDGTEVTDEIQDSTRTENLQTYAEFIIDFNTKDVREYYEAIGALDQARYNSIGLFIGDKVQQADGSYEYANVRLFSYLNIDNKSVKIKTASQYVYRVLSLV
jgi:hypothetical protein